MRSEMGDSEPTQSRLTSQQSQFWLYVVGIVLLAGLAFALRSHKISEPTISHSELYNTPGIDLPPQATAPAPRTDIIDAGLSAIHAEPHPPGFHMFMYLWTAAFGTREAILRLPMNLSGAGVVLMIGVLAAQFRSYRVGVIAALIYATMPNSVALDRVVRMYPVVAFLSVLATSLLVLTYRSVRWQRLLILGYLTTVATGLLWSLFFWPLLGSHFVFGVLGPRNRDSDAVPSQARWQLWLMIIASPLLSIAAYQSGRKGYMNQSLAEAAFRYFQLFYAFPTTKRQLPTAFTVWSGVGYAVVAFTIVLIVMSLVRIRRQSKRSDSEFSPTLAPPLAFMIATVVLTCVTIGVFAYAQAQFDNYFADRTPLVWSTLIIPPMFFTVDLLVRRYWTPLSQFTSRLGAPLPLPWLIVCSCVLPIATVSLVTFLGIPMLEARAMYVTVPFMALLVATGVLAMPGKWVGPALALAALLTIQTIAFRDFDQRFLPPTDYKGLGSQLNEQKEDSDLWLIHNHFAVIPIFYYLKHQELSLAFDNYAQAIEAHEGSRVWVFQPEGIRILRPMREALVSFELVRTVEARRIKAHLYERKPDSDAN